MACSDSEEDDQRKRHYPGHGIAKRYTSGYGPEPSGYYGPQYFESYPESHRQSRPRT